MTEKIVLSEGTIPGNKGFKQPYFINYMPEVRKDKEVLYLQKIEFGLKSFNNKLTCEKCGTDFARPPVSTLRIIDPASLFMLIKELAHAHHIFKFMKGELNDFNRSLFAEQLYKYMLEDAKNIVKNNSPPVRIISDKEEEIIEEI